MYKALLVVVLCWTVASVTAQFSYSFVQPAPNVIYINTTRNYIEVTDGLIVSRVRTPAGKVHTETVSFEWKNLYEEWVVLGASVVHPNCTYNAVTHTFSDWRIEYDFND
jgi:hypothetical protein